MKKIDKSLIIVLIILLIIYGICYLFTGTGFPCIFNKITNLYCPGCGITRMFVSIFHLEIYQAFRFNPLLFILLILSILYFIFNWIGNKVFNRQIIINDKIYIGLLVVVIVYWILRNIEAFSFLAPTIVK